MKTKGALLGIAAAVVVAGLTFASMAVTTTSGAGTDDTDETPTAVAQPTVAPSTPPQAPIEPPTNPVTTNAGNQAGAGTLPSAGYGMGETGNSMSTMLVFGLAGAILAAGTGLMIAGGRAPGRKQ